MSQQKGNGHIFSKSRVAPNTQSESKKTTQRSSSEPNSFEKKLREAKLKLKKVATSIPKRSPIIVSSSSECPICLESMNRPNQLLTTTCCNKKFHKKCIEKCKTRICPLCRHDYLSDIIYNKLTDIERNSPNVKNIIKQIITKFKEFENIYDYDFLNQVISNNRIKIIERSVKRYIKDPGNINDIIEHEINKIIY